MANGMKKFGVHFRFDTRPEHHDQMIEAIEMHLKDHMLEPAREMVWNHLKMIYFVTDEDGPRIAKLSNFLYDSDELVYAGPI